ncbi:Proteasome activator complex subunit 3 [Fasciola gigantica]|uniref:Proteasome activator complex subunit 3 n=2 Tax=Fasciola TaxID=6191 RepID=A0A2H1C9S1_FASHE|nr:Proteasome activator complex subunit 3 [Fasciola hepatica]TPP60274.1 Proteasome activator complex subunit 3 [Fasciola gigantica]
MPVAVGDYLRAYFTREAEERLRDSIPNKIREIDDLLRESLFDLSTGIRRVRQCADGLTSQLESTIGESKKDGVSPLQLPIVTNEVLEQAYTATRPFILQLIEDSQILRMWVQLNIPRIEDGNNFGVSVQEEVLMETTKAEMEASSMLDFFGDYLMYRAKVASKICKWPTLSDYRRALADTDEGAYIRLRMNVRDIRNHYSRLYDIYHKNALKLRMPRNEMENQINIMY